jgi:hypothetical protein
MYGFPVMKKEGNIFSGKPCILTGLEVHDKAAYDEQTGYRKPGQDTHFLRFKYIVNCFHRNIP